MSAPVRIEARAWGDIRFATLARLLGLADSDHALIKVARLWSWQTEHFAADQPTYVVDSDTIESVLGPGGPAALVRAKLATEVDGGFRLHGTEGQIEWCQDLSSTRQQAGRARAAGARRDARGRLLPRENSEQEHESPARTPADVQHKSSSSPAQSSAPSPSLREDLPPARDPAVPSPAPAPQESQPIPPEPPKTPDPEPGIQTPERDPEPQNQIQQPEQPNARTLLAELERARQEAARELAVEVLPLPFGDVGERDLADRLAAARSQGPAAVDLVVRQTRHAIAMAKLETVRGEKSIEWFTGAVFAERNFRRLVGKTAKPTMRAGPRGSAERAPQQRIRPKVADEIPPD